jgi:hypothetical protein
VVGGFTAGVRIPSREVVYAVPLPRWDSQNSTLKETPSLRIKMTAVPRVILVSFELEVVRNA